MHVSRKAIAKYGLTPGCPGCREIIRRGHKPGRLGFNHNEICKMRIFQEMTKDPQYKTLVDKHGDMKQSGELDVVTEEMQRQQVKWLKQAITKIEQSINVMENNLGGLLNNVTMKEVMKELDVAEVYSPPRVVEMARKLGFKAGLEFGYYYHG